MDDDRTAAGTVPADEGADAPKGAGQAPDTVTLATLRERISYAIAIGAKGKRYRRIVDDGEILPGKAAGTGWDRRDWPRRRNEEK
ncbi:MAG: hypothetical protein M0006_15180 [Magnetospirillum sp.]|nr:hypothetical protein [Magnetospirillum sp.]